MKQNEVPQEDNAAFDGERKAVYAVDDSGHYTTAASSGWQVEEVVTGQAVEEYRRLAREAWQAARDGRVSPLAYHMYAQRMEPETLAPTAGVWRLVLRRHLKPGPFSRLKPTRLVRYAEALGLRPEQLRELPDEPE